MQVNDQKAKIEGVFSEMSTYKTVEKVNMVLGGSKIIVRSAGFKSGNFASIKVNGQMVLPRNKARRGMNIVALDSTNHRVVFRGSYDVFGNKNASRKMLKDLTRAPTGTIIIAAAKDEASR